MFKNLILGALVIGFTAVSCSDDDNDTDTDNGTDLEVNAGTISGGPFEFDVDGEPDMVSGITLDDTCLLYTSPSPRDA